MKSFLVRVIVHPSQVHRVAEILQGALGVRSVRVGVDAVYVEIAAANGSDAFMCVYDTLCGMPVAGFIYDPLDDPKVLPLTTKEEKP